MDILSPRYSLGCAGRASYLRPSSAVPPFVGTVADFREVGHPNPRVASRDSWSQMWKGFRDFRKSHHLAFVNIWIVRSQTFKEIRQVHIGHVHKSVSDEVQAVLDFSGREESVLCQ